MMTSERGAPGQWRAVSSPCLKTRRWDDGLVAYSVKTGDTFLFGPPALAILDKLAAGPASVDELGFVNDEDALQDLLSKLEQAGLVLQNGHADR